MTKFLAVIKREYVQRVRSKFFVVATILGPLVMLMFTVLPALMFSIKAGGPTKLAIVDQTGKMYARVAREISGEQEVSSAEESGIQPPAPNAAPTKRAEDAGKMIRGSYELQEARLDGRSLTDLENELNSKVANKELNGYLVLPPDFIDSGKAKLYVRNTADVFSRDQVQRAISRAIRTQRLIDAHVTEDDIEKMSRPVEVEFSPIGGTGAETKGEAGFILPFGLGLLLYMCVLLYGQIVLGAVIEEKETRIAEVLFSSMRSFPLMMGKIVGVSLVALTQLSIWGAALAAFTVFSQRGGMSFSVHIPPILFLYFGLFFLMGYFLYSSIYALIGSMVTTTQEGGQLALPIVFTLVAGLYMSFSIIRSPNSSLAFWASMFPFFAPITMMVRIVTETPPWWQIALSLGIGFGTVVLVVWLASRVYRVGMLMYGKKATIPEVLRWVRQQ